MKKVVLDSPEEATVVDEEATAVDEEAAFLRRLHSRLFQALSMLGGQIWNSQGPPLVVSSKRKLLANEHASEIGPLDRCRTE